MGHMPQALPNSLSHPASLCFLGTMLPCPSVPYMCV